MRWLPRAYTFETTMCFSDGEAEGRALCIEWLGYIVELAISRRTRAVG